jgi:DNA polymerase-3 subunit alpha
VHACGTVVSREPLTNYMALQRSPQDENATITQFEMHSIEDLGLLKIDLLGLKTLTIIEETLRLLREIKGIELDISKLPLDDKKTYKLLQTGETTGVFQYESSGMRRYMKDLKPTELEDLIALVALYRPGPLELIPSFIDRKFGREKVTYVHPKLEPILKNTYGVGVYQEQMMQIARDLGGYTLPEADTLRKAIGKKIKALLDEQEKELTDGMIKNGIDAVTAKRIWDMFPPFARYGFNRSHAACYAIIGYQTAYLKSNYPVEFMTAVLNNASDDVERIAFLINDIKRMGIEVLPPDINKSSAAFTPDLPYEASAKEGGTNIRFGISAIKNIGENITKIIVEERLRNGQFETLADFATRVNHRDLNKKSLEALTKAGALDSLGIERGQVVANIDDILKVKSGIRSDANSNQGGLFVSEPIKLKVKLKEAEPATKMQKLAWEKELMGLYVTDHPLKEYGAVAKVKGLIPIGAVLKETSESKTVKTYGLIIKIQQIHTKTGDPMLFAKIEDLSDTIEVLVFKDTLAKTVNIWAENNIIQISGRVSKRNGETKFIVNEAQTFRI